MLYALNVKMSTLFITIQFNNKDLQLQNKDGVQKAVVNILGHITSISRRLVNRFEDTVTVNSPPDMLQAFSKQKSIYQKTIPLLPGTYRLHGGHANNGEEGCIISVGLSSQPGGSYSG